MNLVRGAKRIVSSMNNLVACCQLANCPLGVSSPSPTPVRNRVNLFAIQIFMPQKNPEIFRALLIQTNYYCAPERPVTASPIVRPTTAPSPRSVPAPVAPLN